MKPGNLPEKAWCQHQRSDEIGADDKRRTRSTGSVSIHAPWRPKASPRKAFLSFKPVRRTGTHSPKEELPMNTIDYSRRPEDYSSPSTPRN